MHSTRTADRALIRGSAAPMAEQLHSTNRGATRSAAQNKLNKLEGDAVIHNAAILQQRSRVRALEAQVRQLQQIVVERDEEAEQQKLRMTKVAELATTDGRVKMMATAALQHKMRREAAVEIAEAVEEAAEAQQAVCELEAKLEAAELVAAGSGPSGQDHDLEEEMRAAAFRIQQLEQQV